MKKYEYLALFVSIEDNKSFRRILSNNSYIFSKIFENFEKIFILDVCYFRASSKKNNLNTGILKEFFPNKNIDFLSIKNFLSLSKFLKNKKIVAFNFFGTSYKEIISNIFFRFFDIKFIQITNSGSVQYGLYPVSNNKIKGILSYFKKNLSHKLTVLLSNIGMIHKIDIRFISNSDYFKYKRHSIFNIIFNFLNLSYVKSLIKINSRAHDIFLETKMEINDSLISVLDEQLNEPQWLRFRKKIEDNEIEAHYKKLNSYLKKLSSILNKKVIICIHPNDDLEYKKKIFRDFEVAKYVTREKIYSSFLIVFFESSAIIDAILLNKNITTIQSSILDQNQVASSMHYAKELSIPISNIDTIDKINIDMNYLTENKIIKPPSELKRDYNRYIEKYICADQKGLLGLDKVIEIIKNKYRLD